jgi:hypothetical protein
MIGRKISNSLTTARSGGPIPLVRKASSIQGDQVKSYRIVTGGEDT